MSHQEPSTAINGHQRPSSSVTSETMPPMATATMEVLDSKFQTVRRAPTAVLVGFIPRRMLRRFRRVSSPSRPSV